MFDIIPDHLKSHEILVSLRHQYTPPKIWEQDTVEIYCGQAWEDWAAPSVINGIGGSEEAVIYLSKELARNGWKVTVYCSCGDMAGEYEGVTYKPYVEFNFNDHHNVVVSWRHNIFRKGMTVKKRYVWLHDVMPEGTYPQKDWDNWDKVIVLSKFHKDIIGLPDSKTYVSRNGINQADFRGSKEVRNPHRMIYTSSYDRGIEHLLKRWLEVRTAVPDVELHLYYGWDTYDRMMEQGRRPREYRDYMTKLMQQDGVFEHGRVGHKKLIKEFYKSGVYVYPTHFEEISCISAMKAQECGCVPVVFDYAALKETVKSGIRLTEKQQTQVVWINTSPNSLTFFRMVNDKRNCEVTSLKVFGDGIKSLKTGLMTYSRYGDEPIRITKIINPTMLLKEISTPATFQKAEIFSSTQDINSSWTTSEKNNLNRF
jgi:glycosyltransferase involved in cell wall biosynthesis